MPSGATSLEDWMRVRMLAWTAMMAIGGAQGGCCLDGGATAAAPMNLAPGFEPATMIATGSADGITDAATLDSSCRGQIPIAPQHVLNVTAAIPNLTLMVNAPEPADTTLVVRTPSGTYLCNDDSEGYNPSLSGAFAPGTYEVFVGAFSSDSRGITYRFGVTEQQGATPTSLGAP